MCAGKVCVFGRARVLARHDVTYFRCTECGFIQTEAPYWHQEAYRRAIASTDVGLVQRNAQLAPLVQSAIQCFFRADGEFLDYGGGYGLLVRHMRDRGLRFYRHDEHCENLFAEGFDIQQAPGKRFELVTAFEVAEHLVSPADELEKILCFAPAVLLSTVLVPDPAPALEAWWYYSLQTGQHISFYTKAALQRLAERHGLSLASSGSLHLLSRRRISPRLFQLATNRRLAEAITRIASRDSLTRSDFEAAISRASDTDVKPGA